MSTADRAANGTTSDSPASSCSAARWRGAMIATTCAGLAAMIPAHTVPVGMPSVTTSVVLVATSPSVTRARVSLSEPMARRIARAATADASSVTTIVAVGASTSSSTCGRASTGAPPTLRKRTFVTPSVGVSGSAGTTSSTIRRALWR